MYKVEGNQIIANRKQVLRNAAAKPVDHYTTVRVPEAILTHVFIVNTIVSHHLCYSQGALTICEC